VDKRRLRRVAARRRVETHDGDVLRCQGFGSGLSLSYSGRSADVGKVLSHSTDVIEVVFTRFVQRLEICIDSLFDCHSTEN
jgi:hypothetical protein